MAFYCSHAELSILYCVSAQSTGPFGNAVDGYLLLKPILDPCRVKTASTICRHPGGCSQCRAVTQMQIAMSQFLDFTVNERPCPLNMSSFTACILASFVCIHAAELLSSLVTRNSCSWPSGCPESIASSWAPSPAIPPLSPATVLLSPTPPVPALSAHLR